MKLQGLFLGALLTLLPWGSAYGASPSSPVEEWNRVFEAQITANSAGDRLVVIQGKSFDRIDFSVSENVDRVCYILQPYVASGKISAVVYIHLTNGQEYLGCRAIERMGGIDAPVYISLDPNTFEPKFWLLDECDNLSFVSDVGENCT